jgi:hypothetical protein
MKSKKNVLMSLSVFITVVFVITLFGQQPQKGYLWDLISAIGSTVKGNVLRIIELEETVVTLRANQSEILQRLNTHTHDLPSHIHDISDIGGVIDADTLQGSDASAFALSAHTHDYESLTEKPTILYDTDVIALISEHALLKQPDYDSGLQDIAQGESLPLVHDLGTANLLVYVVGGYPESTYGYFIQDYYGGHRYYSRSEDRYYYEGLRFEVDNYYVWVRRLANDSMWDYIRVRIWKLD